MPARPYVDTVKGSTFPNMKELRAPNDKHLALRAFVAFDPKRSAILPIGSDKHAQRGFCKKLIRETDKLYRDRLRTLKKLGSSLSCIQNVRKDTMAIKTLSYDGIADKLMTKASCVRSKKRADAILKRIALDQLRKDRKMTQGKLALAMNMQQSEVSRLEKRTEVKLGTLRTPGTAAARTDGALH
jgi:DNA-binding Xre family transcriptional regulator